MEIEVKIDELTIERYRFTYLRGNIFLDSYYLLQKENSRKRKFNIVKRYDRIMDRTNNISESEVNITEEIKQKAFDLFTSNIKVLKWSERKTN